jgi:hypothetical protein
MADNKNSNQAQGDEKLEALIEDLKFDDIPEDRRAEVKKLVAEKVKQYDRGFRQKTEELSEERKKLQEREVKLKDIEKIQKEFEDDPELAKVIDKTYYDYKSGKFSSDKAKSDAVKKFDKLIDNAENASQREALRELRDAIKEEVPNIDTKTLESKITQLEQELSLLKTVSLTGLTEKVDSQVSQLKERFGGEVVSKYEKEIRVMMTKYPHQTAWNIFKTVANDTELKSALLKEVEYEKSKELERKKLGASSSDSSISSDITLEKDASGTVKIESIVSRIKDRMNKAGIRV